MYDPSAWMTVFVFGKLLGALMGGNVLMDNRYLLIMDGHARHVTVNGVAKVRVM